MVDFVPLAIANPGRPRCVAHPFSDWAMNLNPNPLANLTYLEAVESCYQFQAELLRLPKTLSPKAKIRLFNGMTGFMEGAGIEHLERHFFWSHSQNDLKNYHSRPQKREKFLDKICIDFNVVAPNNGLNFKKIGSSIDFNKCLSGELVRDTICDIDPCSDMAQRLAKTICKLTDICPTNNTIINQRYDRGFRKYRIRK